MEAKKNKSGSADERLVVVLSRLNAEERRRAVAVVDEIISRRDRVSVVVDGCDALDDG